MDSLDEPQPTTDLVEFVGGPRAGERTKSGERRQLIESESGRYRRSVQCAEDGALRYVWEALRVKE